MDLIDTENRSVINNNNILYRRKRNCCSFCHLSGHNIVSCNSDRLHEFEIICSEIVRNFTTKNEFNIWLIENYNENKFLLKAFSKKKIGISSNNIVIIMDAITDFIFKKYKNENENLINDIVELLLDINNNDLPEPINENYINQNLERMLVLEFINHNIYNNQPLINNEIENNENISNNIIFSINKNKKKEENNICNCDICYENKKQMNFVKLNCNHEFCYECMIKSFENNVNKIKTCALCRSIITEIETSNKNIIKKFK